MSTLGQYECHTPGFVHVLLPAPLPAVLALAANATQGLPPTPGPGAWATVSPDLSSDPLAALEADFAADTLAASLDTARNEQASFGQLLLDAVREDGSLFFLLSTEGVGTVSGWLNRLYVGSRSLELDDVEVGGAQSIFTDDTYAALLGTEADGEPDELEMGSLVPMLLAQLSVEFAQVHLELVTAVS